MTHNHEPPEQREEPQPDDVPEQTERSAEAPPSVEELRELGYELEKESGLNLKSEGEPSGPTTPHVEVKRPAGRFARVAAETVDGDQSGSDL